MYDCGSNINLIAGKLAEMENMKIVSNRPGKVRVAGGQTIFTKYGVCIAVLGPSITGENRYLDCQGLHHCSDLRKQSLKELNKELLSFGLVDQHTLLPRYAVGGTAGVLVGIQGVQLDLGLIAVLPSGIGVYRCPFVDMRRVTDRLRRGTPVFSTATANTFNSLMFSRLIRTPSTLRKEKKYTRVSQMADQS